MAESLGTAKLTLAVDDAQFRAGLQGAEQQAAATGRKIGQSLGNPNTLNGLNARLADVRQRLGDLAIGSKEFRELQQEAKQLEQQLGRVNGQASRLGDAFGVARNALATFGAVQVFRDLIRSASELEGITRKLDNTLGKQGAQQAIGFLRGLSDSLGLSFNVLADSFGSFTAAASAANIPLEEQKGLFAAVSTSAQRLGLSNDAINGSLLALQQVASKGTVQMEELRGQLGERLPTAFAATAQGLGITNAELIKLVESGKLTADKFFPALTKGLDKLNGSGTGSVPTAAQNFAAFGNELEKLKAQAGTEFLPDVVAGVQLLTKALGGFNVQIQANKLGFGQGMLGNLFGVVSAEGAQAVGTLQQLANTYGLSQKQARALFTDAVKDVGATANAFGQLNLSAEQYQKILAQLPGRAAAFTKESRASAAAAQKAIQDAMAAQAALRNKPDLSTIGGLEARINTLQAASKKLDFGSNAFQENARQIKDLQQTLTNATADRSEVQSNIVSASREELIAAADLVGKQGAQLTIAQTRLGIARQIREVGAADGALGIARRTNDPTAIKAASQALQDSGDTLRTAMITGAEAARQALKDAATGLTNAFKSLQSARQNAYDLLPDYRQEQLRQQAEASIYKQIKSGELDYYKVRAALGGDAFFGNADPQKLLGIGGQADAIAEANKALTLATQDQTKAQIEATKITAEFNKASATLVGVLVNAILYRQPPQAYLQ